MLDGVMLLWFILTAISVLFVSIDIRRTPEATALRWGFIILTIFAGPLAAFFYVLGCREPFPGAHERYVSSTWKQVLGSTMHCASGDGLGIITGAAVGSLMTLPFGLDFGLEYALGFGFGWLFFQAFAMRDMAGGDYVKSLRMTFIPEFLSMNVLMAGMTLVSRFWMPQVEGASHPSDPAFWFIMSMSLIAGFIVAYPMNWWLVTRGLKHGMMTVRSRGSGATTGHDMSSMKHDMSSGKHDMPGMDHDMPSGKHDMPGMDHGGHGHAMGGHAMGEHATRASRASITIAGVVSIAILAAAITIVLLYGPQGA